MRSGWSMAPSPPPPPPEGNAPEARTVLALNAGSSTLKYGVYRVAGGVAERLLGGTEVLAGPPQAPVARIAELLVCRGLGAPAAIGHRIVHGGLHCRAHTLIDAQVLRQLQAAAEFAPLHVPPALALVRQASERFPGASQAACLDTAFHAGMPEVARTLPVSRELRAIGVERYGFHGLSCESIVRQLGDRLPARLVIAHLGHGASVTAVAAGRSVDTTMGLTPSGGVIMSTRCGDVDPGLFAYLVRERGFDAAALERLIDADSGMQGISGRSGDMRVLRSAAAADPAAQLAIDMFCYSVRKAVAAMASVLGGVDLLVFTGGIGEHDADSRAAICAPLRTMGVCADAAQVRVIPTQEEEQIAVHTQALVDGARG